MALACPNLRYIRGNKCKKLFIDRIGAEILTGIDSGAALDDPSILTRWAMLTFSNLKTYCHYYWLAFPAISLPIAAVASPPIPICNRLAPGQLVQLHAAYKEACDRSLTSLSARF